MKLRLKAQLLRVRWRMAQMMRRPVKSWLYKVTRPSSPPYVTGDGFRRMANHIYDESRQVNFHSRVEDGDLIFVATHFVPRFLAQVDPKIRASYRLITHNSDSPVDEELIARSSRKVLVWFAQNNIFQHETVVPIPIGLENLHYYNAGIPNMYTKMRGAGRNPRNRILAGFTIGTNARERQRIHELALRAPSVEVLRARLDQQDYLRTLTTYRFMLSPPGNGLDTHRTWEAMYLGVIPIVKDSVAMRAFEQLGLPIWILQRWDDILAFDAHTLEAKYEDLQKRFCAPALFMDYWQEVIRGKRWLSPERTDETAVEYAGRRVV